MSPWMHLCSVVMLQGGLWQVYVADGAWTGQGQWFHGMPTCVEFMTVELGPMGFWIGSRMHGYLRKDYCSQDLVNLLAQGATMGTCSKGGKPESILRMRSLKLSLADHNSFYQTGQMFLFMLHLHVMMYSS